MKSSGWELSKLVQCKEINYVYNDYNNLHPKAHHRNITPTSHPPHSYPLSGIFKVAFLNFVYLINKGQRSEVKLFMNFGCHGLGYARNASTKYHFENETAKLKSLTSIMGTNYSPTNPSSRTMYAS